jgi:NAD(P)-dependent dehydrogenase (short-subunit alcohol dehydrogenase family)
LVTGGSRGIGAAIVRRLASQGAAVAVLTQDGHTSERPSSWAERRLP